MDSLTHDQAEFLWGVVKGLAILLGFLFTLIGGLAAGFKWLDGRIEHTAKQLLNPIVERVALAEKTADAAHRRIDEIVGKRL